MDALPKLLLLRCDKFKTSEELCAIFLKQKAVFHKSCMACFNKQKLDRKRKLCNVRDSAVFNENDEKIEQTVCDSSAKRRSTRNNPKIEINNKTCFFCEEPSNDLSSCQTVELNQKVTDMATEMGDSQILAKLCQDDMVAAKAKYHLKCLVEFKNKYRSFKTPEKVVKESSLIEGI